MNRKGLGKGTGRKGYYNLIPKDKKVHSDSAKGRKQPQKLTKGFAKSLRLSVPKRRDKDRLLSGAGTSRVVRIDDFIIKIQENYKDKSSLAQSVEKRCKALKLIKKKFPYYPDCVTAKIGEEKILVTKFEGWSLDKRKIMIHDLSSKHKKQLADVVDYWHDLGYTFPDIQESNISIDKNDNAVFIDFGFALTKNKAKNLKQKLNVRLIDYSSIFETWNPRYRKENAQKILRFIKKHKGIDLKGKYNVSEYVFSFVNMKSEEKDLSAFSLFLNKKDLWKYVPNTKMRNFILDEGRKLPINLKHKDVVKILKDIAK